MKRSSCRRCDGTHFLRVRRVLDVAGAQVDAWGDRPVRAERIDGELRGVGYFETWVCRGCGFTEWYANDWQSSALPTVELACVMCATPTPTVVLLGLELVTGRPSFLGPGPTHQRATKPVLAHLSVALSLDGLLQTKICTRCDHVTWRGLDYEHLGKERFAWCRLGEDVRGCLSCGESACLFDDQLHDAERLPVCVAYSMSGHGLEKKPEGTGRFQLRICRPCGNVEWHATQRDRIAKCDGVELVPSPHVNVSGPQAGPYR